MKTLHLVAVVGLTATSCSLEPALDKRTNGLAGNELDQSAAGKKKTSDAGVGSVKAYESTVYKLVRQVTCKKCHAAELSPFFAADDVEEAHDSVIDTQKVNFEAPESSRLVQRLSAENHNCWSDCADDAKAMLAAINEWIKLRQESDQGGSEGAQTYGLTLADAQPKEGAMDQGTIFVEAESGVLSAPMRAENDGAASGGEYAVIPTGNGGLLQAGNAAAGIATYTIDIVEPGPYRLWGLISTANGNENSFFIRVDNGAFLPWRTAITMGQWEWNLASDLDAGGTIHSLNLTAGSHTIQLSQREDGARIDALALTNDVNFDGGGRSGSPISVLRFDLAELVGTAGVYFEIEATEFDQFSFKFKNPTIITETARVKVKGVKIKVNGVYDPQHATYVKINEAVEAPGRAISSAAMIVPTEKGFGLDEISVAFDELKVK